MGNLFGKRRYRFTRVLEDGKTSKPWFGNKLDIKANLVCKPCNEGWMSNLESRHAKPAMTPLILGHSVPHITPLMGHAIARFAFKTAVIVDHMRGDGPFFARAARHHFAKSLKIPRHVYIWFAGYNPVVAGRVLPFWYDQSFEGARHLKMYACTYAVGHLIFQVVAADYKGISSFTPREGFEHLAIPLWPNIWESVSWPPPNALKRGEFETFAERWGAIRMS